MRLLAILGFLGLGLFSLGLTLYLLLLGMAPGMPSLDYTGFFIYGPGPGFLLLLLWLGAAGATGVAALLAGRQRGTILGGLAWAALAGLCALQLLILADFRGVF